MLSSSFFSFISHLWFFFFPFAKKRRTYNEIQDVSSFILRVKITEIEKWNLYSVEHAVVRAKLCSIDDGFFLFVPLRVVFLLRFWRPNIFSVQIFSVTTTIVVFVCCTKWMIFTQHATANEPTQNSSSNSHEKKN